MIINEPPDRMFADALYAALRQMGAIVERQVCRVPRCGIAVHCGGLCQMHYRRWAKHGDVRIGAYRED